MARVPTFLLHRNLVHTESPQLPEQNTVYLADLHDDQEFLKFDVPPPSNASFVPRVAFTVTDPTGSPLSIVRRFNGLSLSL